MWRRWHLVWKESSIFALLLWNTLEFLGLITALIFNSSTEYFVWQPEILHLCVSWLDHFLSSTTHEEIIPVITNNNILQCNFSALIPRQFSSWFIHIVHLTIVHIVHHKRLSLWINSVNDIFPLAHIWTYCRNTPNTFPQKDVQMSLQNDKSHVSV